MTGGYCTFHWQMDGIMEIISANASDPREKPLWCVRLSAGLNTYSQSFAGLALSAA